MKKNTFKDYIVREVLVGNGKFSILKIIKVVIFGSSNQKVIFYYRLAKHLYANDYKRISILILRKIENGYGIYVSLNASIGIGLKLPHPNGIVIGNGVNIGENCTVYQQVTFGGARLGDAQKSIYPKIGDNVVVFAGAKIIGNVSIGSNCVIGANSVVIKNIPDGCTAFGVPARIKESNGSNEVLA